MVERRARSSRRLFAAGRRTVRRLRRPEYFALRFGSVGRFHHRGREGSRRAWDDHQDARRLRHPDRRAGHRALGRPGAARGAGAGVVRQSVPDRARRAELQPRHRGGRGADAGGPGRARARRHRGGCRAPADRDRGRRPASGAQGRPHAGVRSQGNRAGAGPAAGCTADPDQDRRRRRDSQIMSGGEKQGALRSIRLHLIVGLAIVVVLAGGLGGWASTAEISGALIAPGQIVVESNVKKVQHPTGGVVGELLAHDGDLVKAGQVVVRLDDTVTKANLAIVTKNLDGLWARAARLQAEQQGIDKIVFPKSLLDRADEPDVKAIIASETKLFDVRVNGRIGQKAQLRERITQLHEEIAGLIAQEQAKDQEIALVQKELTGVRQLYDQHLVQLTRLTTLERDAARLNGERAQYIASRAQAKGKITETELQSIQVDKDMGSDVSKDLRETTDTIGEYVERKVTTEDQLRPRAIRRPPGRRA